MRVALIGCTVNPRKGGMGRALYDHATALAEAGQEVTVYALPPFPDGAHPFTIRPIKYFLRAGKAAWGTRFDPPLDAYDVVHLHLPFFGVAEAVVHDYTAQGTPASETPVVRPSVPAAGRISPSLFSASQKNHARSGSDTLLSRACPCAALVATYHMDAIGTGLKKIYFNWWYRHRFKNMLAACDAIAVTSRAYARDSWLPKAGVDVEKCEEILLRVDTGTFSRSVWDSSSASRPQNDYFLFVGALDRAHYFKGLSVLLRAFRSLDPRFRGDDKKGGWDDRGEAASGMTEQPRLVVVGAGELLEHYKKEAIALGIADRVTFTGGVSDEELARWYAGARALVLPSTDRSEAFGIVLIEAMACGTPVIASDLPGVRTVVERVQGGVLVPSGIASGSEVLRSPRNDKLTLALQNMWQHPWSDDERAALAERAATTYGRATLANQLLQWYRGIIIA